MLSELRYKSDNHKTDGRLYSAASGSPPNPAAVVASVGANGFSKLFLFLSRLPAFEYSPSSFMTLADLLDILQYFSGKIYWVSKQEMEMELLSVQGHSPNKVAQTESNSISSATFCVLTQCT